MATTVPMISTADEEVEEVSDVLVGVDSGDWGIFPIAENNANGSKHELHLILIHPRNHYH